jgi:hypothetical protein
MHLKGKGYLSCAVVAVADGNGRVSTPIGASPGQAPGQSQLSVGGVARAPPRHAAGADGVAPRGFLTRRVRAVYCGGSRHLHCLPVQEGGS